MMQASGNNELHLVVFKLGEEEYGVDINKIREIIRYPQITRVPNTPHYVDGVINLRGQITTIMNLRSKFSMESVEKSDNTRILIIDLGNELIGIVVDGVSEVLKVDPKNVLNTEGLESAIDSDYISGMANLDGRLIILIDMIKAFKS